MSSLNPCGKVMDLRRHATIDEVYFGESDSSKGKIQWFVAPPGADWFSDPTVFRSLDHWDRLPPVPGRPGVIPSLTPYPYSKGQTVPLYTGQGHTCGDPSWWVAGVPLPLPPNPVRNPDGVPECCVPERFGVASWTATGRASWQSSVPPVFSITSIGTQGGGLVNPFLQIQYFGFAPASGMIGFVGVFCALPVSISLPPGVQLLSRQRQGDVELFVFFYPDAINSGRVFFFRVSALDSWFYVADWIFPRGLSLPVAALAEVHAAGRSALADTGVAVSDASRWRMAFAGTFIEAAGVGGIFGFQQLEAFADTSRTASISTGYKLLQPSVTAVEAVTTLPRSGNWSTAVLVLPFTLSAASNFQLSGTGSASWVGFAEGQGTFAMSASGSAGWIGFAEGQGTFAMSAVGSASWIGTGLIGSPFALTATGSAAFAGAGLDAAPFAMTATGSASFVGTSLSGPSVVQRRYATGTTQASITWSPSTVAGNNLYVFAACRNPTSSTFTAPAGWTQVASVDLSVGSGPSQHTSCALFRRENSASQASTGNFGNSGGVPTDFWVAGLEVSGLSSSGSSDKNANNSSTGSTAPSSGTTATTTTANELWIAALVQNASSASFSSPTNGFTIEDQRDTAGTSILHCALLDKIVSSTGTASTGVTSNQNARWVGLIGTFK